MEKVKRKTAKEILAESFRELAQIRSVDRITVKDITENCGYSSATFYRHFKDKYDLIAWDYSRNISEIMDKTGVDGRAWKGILTDASRHFEKEKAYLANLFLHTTGLDSFIHYMVEANDSFLRDYVMRSAGTDRLDEETKIYIHHYCHGNVALICDWVMDRFSMTADELAEVFEKALPEPLWKYMHEQ